MLRQKGRAETSKYIRCPRDASTETLNYSLYIRCLRGASMGAALDKLAVTMSLGIEISSVIGLRPRHPWLWGYRRFTEADARSLKHNRQWALTVRMVTPPFFVATHVTIMPTRSCSPTYDRQYATKLVHAGSKYFASTGMYRLTPRKVSLVLLHRTRRARENNPRSLLSGGHADCVADGCA